MRNKLIQFIEWYKALPTKKSHVEFITAVLSVPVMLTVIILNLNNLNQQKKPTPNEKISPIQVIITGNKESGEKNPVDVPVSSPTPSSCIKEVGPVSILSPRENEVITKDPLCITIATQSGYCLLVWSYNLDNGGWSDYTDKNICLHNLTNGNKVVQLRIKSTVSEDTTTLQRSFVYQGNIEPSATPPVASSSAGL